MHHDPAQPTGRRGQPAVAARAVEEHGRAVTTNTQAAAWYRQAQQAVDSPHALTALRLAVKADPAFGLAVADLDAITEAPPSRISGRHMNWERHHIEIVRTAAAGKFSRADDLLRDHLASVGCDPLALRIVTHLRRGTGDPEGLDDLTSQLPDCHPAFPWP